VQDDDLDSKPSCFVSIIETRFIRLNLANLGSKHIFNRSNNWKECSEIAKSGLVNSIKLPNQLLRVQILLIKLLDVMHFGYH
jgi:hypothetical protein